MLQRRHWSSFSAEAGRGNPVNLQRYSSLYRGIILLSQQPSRSASSGRNLAFWKIQSVVDSIRVQCDNYHPNTKTLPIAPLLTPPSSFHPPLFLSSSYIIPSHISSPSSSGLPPLPPAPPFSKIFFSSFSPPPPPPLIGLIILHFRLSPPRRAVAPG